VSEALRGSSQSDLANGIILPKVVRDALENLAQHSSGRFLRITALSGSADLNGIRVTLSVQQDDGPDQPTSDYEIDLVLDIGGGRQFNALVNHLLTRAEKKLRTERERFERQ